VNEDLAVLERELEAELCRRSFADFFRAAWPIHEPATPLKWGWALDAVCAHLQALIEDWGRRQRDPAFEQRMRDLLVTMPPGSAKSRLLAYLMPWAWLRWPTMRAIALCCNPRVALRDSMFARDLIASRWYQRSFAPAWSVRQDVDAKGLFSNTVGGFRAAMGFDARIVGERGDLIIVDDPHDPDEAESDAKRDGVHDRWDNSISNRVNDLGSSIRVGIAQRTHEDDWSARRIAEHWTHLDLPMLFEPDRGCETPLGKPDRRTTEGECLHPERFPSEVIAAERGKGERRWSTLYQGRPTPAGGALVKLEWLRFWRRKGMPSAPTARPRGCWQGPSVELDPAELHGVVIAADLAMGKATRAGDYNAIVAVGRKGSAFVVLDVWRRRAEFPEVQRAFRGFASRWPSAKKVIERAAAGGSLESSLAAEIPGIVGVPPQGSKEQRVHAVLAFFEAGNVHLDEHATYLEAVVAELTQFPSAPHDDVVDALSLALGQMLGAAPLERWRILADMAGAPPTRAELATAAVRAAREAALVASDRDLAARVLVEAPREIGALRVVLSIPGEPSWAERLARIDALEERSLTARRVLANVATPIEREAWRGRIALDEREMSEGFRGRA